MESGSLRRLREKVLVLREKIEQYRERPDLNEQNTKGALITPLLGALGWDTSDPDEVHYEFKNRKDDNPVDYALKLDRSPCVLIEAKALRLDISDRKWTKQLVGYSTEAGVGWIVLTNGIDYHLYNAHAPVPLEGKLFKKLSLAETEVDELVSGLSLLSKEDFKRKRIDRAWDAHHTDTQVESILRNLFSAEAANDELLGLIAGMSGGNLTTDQVVQSLHRADVRISFPPDPLTEERSASKVDAGRKMRRTRAAATSMAKSPAGVRVEDLLSAGILRAPVQLVAKCRGQELHATLTREGAVVFDGVEYGSLSTAAGAARASGYEGDQPHPATNGWTFWRVKDPATGELVRIDSLRKRIES